ncbi:MAG: metal-dependent transcriptional regulator [Phycisphaerae bacterium]|nr:metal-dependent transcriptional regulator [Phycisphaerae bacterium]
METWKEFDQNVISHSAAHHLMAIDDLVGKLGYARVSDVARLLSITRGSVSISLQPLKKADLVLQDENRHLQLSPKGQALVDAIKTKRSLIERLLTELLGVAEDWAKVDACKIEHLLSNTSAQRIVQLFRFLDSGTPTVSAFTEALRAFHSDCSHDPKICPTCEKDCMAERLPED